MEASSARVDEWTLVLPRRASRGRPRLLTMLPRYASGGRAAELTDAEAEAVRLDAPDARRAALEEARHHQRAVDLDLRQRRARDVRFLWLGVLRDHTWQTLLR